MLLRKLLLAAALMAPLATLPVSASAQTAGRDRAVVATAQANSVSGWENGKATGRPTALPKGIANGAGGSTLPPGISRTRPQPEVESDPEPEDPPTETCGSIPYTQPDGTFGVLDTCTGVFTPL